MTHQPNNVSAAGVLLPCPFCGATPDLPDALGTQYEIECDCGMARSSVQISDSMTLEERQSGWDSLTLKFDAQYVERAKEEAVSAWNRRAAASAQATGHPTPISISTDKICEVAKKYNLGNPRLDALRGFVNEIIIVNGAEYAKSE